MSDKKKTAHEKMIEIFRAILVHMNGYDRSTLADDVVEENEGHDLWEEVKSIIEP